MSIFICPVCGIGLERDGNTFVCQGGHAFDISAEGYVNLLSGKMRANSGDNAQMMSARSRFLNNGYYSCLKVALSQISADRLMDKTDSKPPLLVDAGSGEGYYTAGIASFLRESGINVRIAGVDISKRGVKAAAKRDKTIAFAVASIFEMPFANESADLVFSIFAPFCENEFCRILKRGGILVIVSPGREHLIGLKTVLYDNPYENEDKIICPQGFEIIERLAVKREITVRGSYISDLFAMTPYFWNTPAQKSQLLNDIECLDTLIDFNITLIKKQ